MSVLLIAGTKCTLATSHAVSGESLWVRWRERQTDGQMDGRLNNLSFQLDAAIVTVCFQFRVNQNVNT